MRRKSIVVQEIGVVCYDYSPVFPSCSKYVFIASSEKTEIRGKFGVVAKALQNLSHRNACILIDKKSRLAPVPQIKLAFVIFRRLVKFLPRHTSILHGSR